VHYQRKKKDAINI